MTNEERNKLWDEFLAAFPAENVREMQLAEYTNANKSDAFIYWLEKRLEALGSILGGSAFKFGIYRRQDLAENPPSGGRRFGVEYAWMDKYGATEQEAFKTVRARIVQVIDAIQEGDLERVDEVDFSPVVKWKIAFLYQPDRKNPLLFPIYKRDCLFYHFRLIDQTTRKDEARYSVMYPSLLEKHLRQDGDVFTLAEELWKDWQQATKRQTRSWAVPLTLVFSDPADARAFCQKGEIVAEDIPDALAHMLAAADISAGDRLALLVDAQVLALAELTSADPEELAWTQKQVSLNPELVPVPTSEVSELDASEKAEIWGEAGEEGGEEGIHYWKVSAETDGSLWPGWRDGGYVSVGWEELGNISHIDELEFEKRRQKADAVEPGRFSRSKTGQVWRFAHIRPGDRIVANQGTKRVFGIGIVTSGYYFANGEQYPHRLKVQWDDLGHRVVHFPHWGRTLLPITGADFEKIVSASAVEPGEAIQQIVPAELVKAKPPEPQNIILYGPPGTGKTYSTVKRALELVVGREKLEGLSDDVLIRMFRDKQSQGQIEFVTFHQSYGYEEFVEGIRPVLEETDTGEVRYEVHDGVFKRIALRAAAEGLRQDEGELSFDVLWSQLIKDLAVNEDRLVKSTTDKTYVMRLSSRDNIRVLPCEVDEQGVVTEIADSGQIASKDNVRLIWEHRRELGVKPEEITSDKTTKLFAKERGGTGGHHYTAIWVAYRELFNLLQSLAGRRQDAAVSITRVQDVLDKRATFSFSADSRPHVLIVDEINRGNISKILGELITLIEADKRLGMPNELRLPLAYSPAHRFGVPPNLHVIGTMNTADRSIALMDVALRRRFTFEELLPSRDVIVNVMRKRVPNPALIDLVGDIFETMNARIRFLYDRDHQIGHAYFLGVTTLDDLKAIFRDRVVPLLQEYFYGAWEKISVVLGCPYGDDGAPRRGKPVVENGAYCASILEASVFGEEQTLGFDHDRYESRVDYRLDRGFVAAESAALVPYFLGILNLSGEDYLSRRAGLITESTGQ